VVVCTVGFAGGGRAVDDWVDTVVVNPGRS